VLAAPDKLRRVAKVGALYGKTQQLLRWLLHGYWPTHVSGAEHVPRSGSVILAGNHPTVLDGLILAVHTPRRVNFLVRADVMALPLLGAFLRWMGYVSVARGGGALQKAEAALGDERCIGIFPEADPSFCLQLGEFRRGAAVLAQSSGAPLVPFALCGTELCCGATARSAAPGPVSLRFGPPLQAAPGESVESLRDRLKAAVQALLDLPAERGWGLRAPRRGLRWILCSAFFRPSSALMLRVSEGRIRRPQ
jgi:1-acyl-sn-glycerol-3-phosphate acyltransferase